MPWIRRLRDEIVLDIVDPPALAEKAGRSLLELVGLSFTGVCVRGESGLFAMHGVAGGMTETGPLAAIAFPPVGVDAERELDYRARTGRIIPGVEIRAVDDDGRVVPRDGTAVGELQARGPWVTASYYREDAAADGEGSRFEGEWLKTGDVGTIDPDGFIQLTDRRKDVIKSGGEWISSVELETRLMAHPEVLEAAVVAVPDPRWEERPLACIVLRDGATVSAPDLAEFLDGQVAKWWLPERWTFLTEIPKTSVGKFDKKELRARHAAGALTVTELT